MEKEFIPYEQALALKELGFDEPCFGWYGPTGILNDWDKTDTLAPTYPQAFRFFREKYNLIGLVEGGYADGKNIFTYIIWNDFKDDWCNEYVSTYEEAEAACLIKLIEICKELK